MENNAPFNPLEPSLEHNGIATFWQELTCHSKLLEWRGKGRKVIRLAVSNVMQ
jgi:hypothetical protein